MQPKHWLDPQLALNTSSMMGSFPQQLSKDLTSTRASEGNELCQSESPVLDRAGDRGEDRAARAPRN